MPKKNAIPTVAYTLRLTEPDRQWLDGVAKSHNVDMPTILRWAIEALKQYAELHQGRLVLPINIREFWEQVQATRPTPQLRAAESPPGADPPGETQPRRSVQFEPAPPSKRRRQQ